MNERLWSVFFEIHSGLPREAPGADVCTRQALSQCDLPADIHILDIGCGPGGQTIVAATQFSESRIVAVDTHLPFLVEVNHRAAAEGAANRVTAVRADMKSLPFKSHCFDLVLAEGSAYVLGIEQALTTCRELLRDGGHVAFTELVWLSDTPPAEAKEFFDCEYPAMTTPDQVIKLIAATGYHLIDHFTLPDSAWWDSYYTPMEKRTATLRREYAGDSEALEVIEESQREIDIRRKYADSYGYEFFIARL